MLADVQKADKQFSRLLTEVEAGEDVVIVRSGKPVARLVKYSPISRQPRQGGQWKGRVQISDDFDQPLPEDISAAFQGKHR